MLDLEGLELLAEELPVHRHPVGDRAAGQVVVEPVHVTARVGHPGLVPERLGDVEDPLLVDAEGDGIGQERLGREELHLQPCRHADRADGPLALVRCGGDRGAVGSARRSRIIALGPGDMRRQKRHGEQGQAQRRDAPDRKHSLMHVVIRGL